MEPRFGWGLVFLLWTWVGVPQAEERGCPAALDFEVRTLAGSEQVNLCRSYLGKVVLLVNTASRCAFTPQYDGLEAIYRRYRDRGLVVLGFPSNDFGSQEPGSEKQVQDFCRLTYGVDFPMFEKTHAAQGRPALPDAGRACGRISSLELPQVSVGPQGAPRGELLELRGAGES